MLYTSYEPASDTPILAHDGSDGFTTIQYAEFKEKHPDTIFCLYFR